MHYSKIKKKSDFQIIIDQPALITGDKALQQEEILANSWGIALVQSLVKSITVDDLMVFYNALAHARSAQIKGESLKATLYMWLDEQANQLCISMISGCTKELPFDCDLEFVESPEIFFKAYLGLTLHGGIPLDEIEFLDDDGFDDDEVVSHYVLKVFSICI